MKNKLLLFLLFFSFYTPVIKAGSREKNVNPLSFIAHRSVIPTAIDPVKKINKSVATTKSYALLSPPTTIAGSSCGDGVNFVQVNVYANGASSDEIIEWFASQNSTSPLYTGYVYSPSIKTTKTFYVRSRSQSTNEVSIRVPVVASVYLSPPQVTLTASPNNSGAELLCLGTAVTFTANGGGDLFEFSVEGVVVQAMSASRTYTTSTLSDGQTVSVRTRYSKTIDGSTAEFAWGTGPLEDNLLSAQLSSNAASAYINGLKVSPEEDKIVIGISGKITKDKSLLLFLDSKTGGFNVSNFGDVVGSSNAKAFNYFNNNTSTFDSYFQADYCLVISTDANAINYFADVIELKSGESIRTSLGSASQGNPTATFGVNTANSGTTDYNLGFEVELLKSLLGYTTGDIKFFGFTMQADDTNFSVTNSFLSPEITSNSEYGNVVVDYNSKDPNPVVFSSAGLTPCYTNAYFTMNFFVKPIASSVVQPTCSVPSGTITIGEQNGAEYSLDGVNYQSSNVFSNLTPNNYTLYTRKSIDGSCPNVSESTLTINAVPTPPLLPTSESVVQPTCELQSGTITITSQAAVEYSLDGTTYQTSNVFSGLAPNSYTLYVRNTDDTTCMAMSDSPTIINIIPVPPVVPTSASVVQPTCATPSGTITITSQSGVEYSLDGTTYQASNSFSGLAPNSYTLYVRNSGDVTCVTMSASMITINALPSPPAVPATASLTQPTCAIPSGTIIITAQSGIEYSLDGVSYQGSNTFSGLAPNDYTLFVRNTGDTSCIIMSPSSITINAIPTPPVVPTTSSIVQPSCTIPSGTIVITAQPGVEYSLDGIAYQTSNSFSGLEPNSYTLYVRNTGDTTCMTMSASPTTVNTIPMPPVVPTLASVVQPTCATPSGTITITSQSGVEYSLDGTTYQASNSFSGLAPNSYTLYVRNSGDVTCVTLSSATVTINPIQVIIVPTTTSVIQPTCAIPSGTIVISTQAGAEYSLDGITYQTSNSFSGLIPNDYVLYVRSILDNSCSNVSSTPTTINTIPTPPMIPTMASVVQPTCEVLSGSIVVTMQAGTEYSLDGITFQTSNSFSGLAPNNYILYVRNTTDNSCFVQGTLQVTIDPLPPLPLVPTVQQIVQPTCFVPTGTITIVAQNDVQYSIGKGFQDSPVFSNLTPGNYTPTVRFKNNTSCEVMGTVLVINPIPAPIQFEIVGDCNDKEYVLTANALQNSYDTNNVVYVWKNNSGGTVGTNSNTLNVSDLIGNNGNSTIFPLTYTLTISNAATGCETTNSVAVESIYCNIQRGISPDGNGMNESFDLSLLDVKKLEVFDRYGIKVYSKANYTNQWKGQSDKGEELPSATYYYVIEFNNAKAKTGWIYLIREK